MRYLGIDFGTRKIGLALSDEEGRMAFPLSVIQVSPSLLDEVVAVIKEKEVGAVVMGDSRDYKGKENPVMEKAHKFIEGLKAALEIEVHLEPEVLSSQEAARFQGHTPTLDASAATIILQSYLDKDKK